MAFTEESVALIDLTSVTMLVTVVSMYGVTRVVMDVAFMFW